jgi:hypothetical protein
MPGGDPGFYAGKCNPGFSHSMPSADVILYVWKPIGEFLLDVFLSVLEPPITLELKAVLANEGGIFTKLCGCCFKR